MLNLFVKHRSSIQNHYSLYWVPKDTCKKKSDLKRNILQKMHRWMNGFKKYVHMPCLKSQQQYFPKAFNNDPSAGSPTETLLRLLLPLNDQV